MSSFEFRFLLATFISVFVHSDVLFNILQMKELQFCLVKFKDRERLMFLAHLDPQNFTAYRQSFPKVAFSSLGDSYSCHFDTSSLKSLV